MKGPVFLDHHATTPCDPRVVEAMAPHFSSRFANPSSPYASARKARDQVEAARAQVAERIGAGPGEIVFTSGATEADNLAVFGVLRAYRERGDHVVSCTTEHRAVLDALRQAEAEGFRVTYLPVDRAGLVDPDDVRRAITARTVLLSFMFANNEIGTVHPVARIGALAKEKGVLFHCDAAQALGRLEIDVNDCGADLLALSAHKVYGPKGIGALYVRSKAPRVRLSPVLYGGGHEKGIRSGTLNVPAIVGFAKACEIVGEVGRGESERVRALRDRLEAAIRARVPEIRINGHPERRLPNNLNVTFEGIAGEGFLGNFPELEVSSGSACTVANVEPSHVLKAIGLSDRQAFSTLRFGLGRHTTEEEIDFAAGYVSEIVGKLRRISRL